MKYDIMYAVRGMVYSIIANMNTIRRRHEGDKTTRVNYEQYRVTRRV